MEQGASHQLLLIPLETKGAPKAHPSHIPSVGLVTSLMCLEINFYDNIKNQEENPGGHLLCLERMEQITDFTGKWCDQLLT